MDLFLIDHYDSFTNNVIDWLAGTDGQVRVRYVAWDDAEAMRVAAACRSPLVISPGPKSPADVPPTLAILRQKLGQVPILGICLGHQMLGAISGARILRGSAPHHGTARTILVDSERPGILAGLAPTFAAGVYNSLVVDQATLPPSWTVNAVCHLGELQAMAYTPDGAAPAFGVQFHPESFLSEGAAIIRANWLAAAFAWQRQLTVTRLS